MTKHNLTATLVAGFLIAIVSVSQASTVPEPFRESDEASTYAIDYSDLTLVLNTVVVDTGRSSRRVAQEAPDVTGTRMKSKVKMTANEGNRFYFETFKKDEESRAYLLEIQKSLEELPAEAPLKYFSRQEQLAYWLNLYNVTVLNQVIDIYPKKDLKKNLTGKRSLLDQKLLTVAGVPLSLNDIQHKILKENYNGDPLIMYGLYQGIIGGPNIRKSAYTGDRVYEALKDNAFEFVNSNRGTYSKYDEFRVSSFYDRNSSYFPNFKKDLPKHLNEYLQGNLRDKLASARKFKANINDWSVTDLGGSHRRIGGSFATSRAALMDSVKGTTPADGGGVMAAAVGAGSSAMTAKGKRLSRIEPELLAILHDINERRVAENERNATVTIEEFVDEEPESAEQTESDSGEGSQ